MTPTELSAAILSLKPKSASRIDVAHQDCPHLGPHWCVTIYAGAICASENGDTLFSATAKARAGFLRKMAERDRTLNMAAAYFGAYFTEAAR